MEDIYWIKEKIHDSDINLDVYAVLNMPGPFEDLGKWAFSSNIAYLEMKPW